MQWGIPVPERLRLVSLLWAAFLACTPFVQAQRLLPFQGRLADSAGKSISDGVRLIQFRIFDAPTAGNSVWPPGEVHRTTVNAGLINVVLGSKTLFTGVDFNRTLYLDIVVDANGDNQITSDDPPLLPRQAILPVIFANESAVSRDSQKLAGYDWSALFGTNNPLGKIDGARISGLTSNSIAAGTINGTLLAPGSVTADKLNGDTLPRMAQVVGTNLFKAELLDTAAWVQPPDMRVTLNLRGPMALVYVSASGNPLTGGGVSSGKVRLNRDNGAEIVFLGSFAVNHAADYKSGFAFQHIFSGLSPGDHTFALELSGKGVGLYSIDPSTYPEHDSRRIQVLELR